MRVLRLLGKNQVANVGTKTTRVMNSSDVSVGEVHAGVLSNRALRFTNSRDESDEIVTLHVGQLAGEEQGGSNDRHSSEHDDTENGGIKLSVTQGFHGNLQELVERDAHTSFPIITYFNR